MFNFGPREHWSTAVAGLSEPDRALIQAHCVHRAYSPGQLVYGSGESGRSVVIVDTGRLRAYQSDAHGQELTLCMLSAGHCTGLTSAISDSPRPLSVEAFDASTVLELRRQDLLALMERLPPFCMNITRLLAAVAQEAVQNSSWFIARNAAERLGHTLLTLTRPQGGLVSAVAGVGVGAAPLQMAVQEPARVLHGLCHDDLASMIGVSRTWVSLILAILEDEKLIRRKRSRIEILDADKLERFCATYDAKARRRQRSVSD